MVLNNTLGLINLGLIYGGVTVTSSSRKQLINQGIQLEGNNEEALCSFIKAYNQGSMYAKEILDRFLFEHMIELFEKGCNIRSDTDYSFTALANKCENEAQNGGSILSTLNIGYMYHHGLGRTVSISKAIGYYQEAVEHDLRNLNIDISSLIKQIYYDNKEWFLENNNVIIAIKRIIDIDNKKNRDSDIFKNEKTVLYEILGIPSIYRNDKAIKFIYEYVLSSRRALQQAYEAYDRQLLLYKQQEAIELEREKLKKIEEEQRRIREQQQIQRENELSQENNNYYSVSDWGFDDVAYRSYDIEQEYNSRNTEGGGSFLRDVAANAIGASIANRGIKKELERQRKEANERERARLEEEDRKKREAAHRSQVEWENVRKANEERRRKGLPELPYPDRFYW